MPPERHSGPSARPPRDRHSGPGGFAGGGPRRSFGGPGHGGPPRDAGPRPPFAPRPFPPPAAAPPPHSIRLRDGEREVEVSGTSDFVRQILDELPALLARLRGEAAPHVRPASISMPPPPPPAAQEPEEEAEGEEEDEEPPAPRVQKDNGRVRRGKPGASLEDRVLDVLARAGHPLSVAGIRQQLGGGESGQQIRRVLERASDRVYSTDERPAAYALR